MALVQAHAAEECSPGDAPAPIENHMALVNNRCPITNKLGRRARGPAFDLVLPRLAKFVEWPPETFRGPETPLVIAILGEDHLGASLENVLSGKTLNGHPWVIVRARHVQDAMDSQILFISSSEGRPERHILEKLKGRSILTVGEREGFLRNGGMVNFVRDGDGFRFEVNPDAGERVGVKISSQILSLARITRDEVLREEGADVQP